VRMGGAKGKLYHTAMIVGGMVVSVAFSALNFKSGYQWIFLISFPLFIRDLMQVNRIKEPHQFDPYLKKLSLTTLLFTVLFGVGVIIACH